MTTRMASKTMPPSWKTKPSQLKSISPRLARMTPETMMRMFQKERHEGSLTRQTHEAKRTATGAAALSIWMKATER